jgi:hypothetical protein
MAISRKDFTVITKVQNSQASVAVQGTYARLSDIHTVNRYDSELVQNPAKVVGDKLPDNVQVFKKVTEATGKLDIYANATDPSTGVPPVFHGQEYSCTHVPGVPAEVELYEYIMALPEFAGCLAV